VAWQLLNATRANFDLTDFVPANSVSIVQSAYGEISTLKFNVDDEAGTVTIAEEDELVFTDGGVKVFAGFVRQLGQTDEGRSTARVYAVTCQDYNSLLDDDVVDTPFFRDGNESDKSLITALFGTFGSRGIVAGTLVQTIRATMGVGIEFFGMTLHEAMTTIERTVGASFYADFDKQLHHYVSETNAAPFNLSDNPNYSTTFEYEDFELPKDSVEMVNAVFVVGDGVSTWRTKGGVAIATLRANGTLRAKVIRDDQLKTLAQCQAVGDAEISANSDPRLPGSLATYKAGLRAGMTVQVTHSGHGISAVTYRIQSVEARPENKDRTRYVIRFGSTPVTLGEVLGRTVGELGRISGVVAETVEKLADLSIAGANLVPNSSFEDGTSWSVGAQWAIGVDPTPNAAYAGKKVGRVTLAAQTAGNLVTPAIVIDRTDDYWVSLFRFVRSRTSGTLRFYVEQLDAANAVLSTHTLDVTAVDTDWTRWSLHFTTAPGAGVIAWATTAAKIRLGVSSAGAAATLSADVDGAQIERSKILTAYAPSPTDLLSAPITSTQIADDAITTPKLAANAVVTGKLAAGAVTANELAANAVTADKIAAGSVRIGDLADNPRNMCPNGSFEDLTGVVVNTLGSLPPGWPNTDSPGEWLVRQRAINVPVDGDYQLLHARAGATTQVTARSDLIPVQGGRRVLIRAWYRGASANNAGAQLQIFTNAIKADRTTGINSPHSSGTITVGTSVTYTAFTQVATLTADTAYLQVALRHIGTTGGTSDTVLFDAVELYYADEDIDHAGGNVKIDASGVTIAGGALVVSNPGGTVIIDGTSDMFKIANTGGHGGSWPAAGSASTATITLATVVSSGRRAVVIWMLDPGQAGSVAKSNPWLHVTTAGVVDYWMEATVDTNGSNQVVLTSVRRSNTVSPGAGTAVAYYYVLKEEAF
jgi:hypothetical protein